ADALEHPIGLGDQRLADMEARKRLALEEPDLQPSVRKNGGRGRAGRPAANDDDIVGRVDHDLDGAQGSGSRPWGSKLRARGARHPTPYVYLTPLCSGRKKRGNKVSTRSSASRVKAMRSADCSASQPSPSSDDRASAKRVSGSTSYFSWK